MNRRIISILTIIVILCSMLAGCRKSEKARKRRSTRKTRITSVTTDPEDESETEDGLGFDTEEDSDPETATDKMTSQDIQFDPDRVLFTYEYNNCAWVRQSEITLIMGDGRLYVFSNDIPSSLGSGADYNTILNTNIEEITKTNASAHIDKSYLMDMYLAASQVDPNAPQTAEHVMCDYGQNSLYYWDENGNKVLCICDGDMRYTIDDPHIADVEYFWNNRFKYIY